MHKRPGGDTCQLADEPVQPVGLSACARERALGGHWQLSGQSLRLPPVNADLTALMLDDGQGGHIA
jgi:hypothetical protein